MDGVLCDFVKRFKDLSESKNMAPREFEEKYGKDNFWDIVDSYGIDFWENMEWMPDGKELWNFCKPFNPTILTAASKHPISCEGKLKWLKREIPELPNHNVQRKTKGGWDGVSKIIMNPDKFRYCTGQDSILIDDTKKKIDPWINAGGIGILHTSASDTISKLKAILV
jgi:5'(3')-deoxyribonucleotidase